MKPLTFWNTASDDDAINAVRAECALLLPDTTISTVDLVTRLAGPKGAGFIDPRQVLFAKLSQWARRGQLAGLFARGPAKAQRGARSSVRPRPYLWHAPYLRCPLCAGAGHVKPSVLSGLIPTSASLDALQTPSQPDSEAIQDEWTVQPEASNG